MKKIGIILSLFLILCLSGCHIYGYCEYGCYENFDEYRNDFNIICEILKNTEKGTYFLDKKDNILSIKKAADDKWIDISEDEQKSLNRIYEGSKNPGFEWIDVTEQYIFFEYDAVGCGILHTNKNIKDIISEFEEKSTYDNEKYGYVEYGDGWYGVYR